MPFNNSSFSKTINTVIPESPKSKDLINSLLRLPDYADHFEIHNNRIIPEPYYRPDLTSKDRLITHFQGVLRIPNTPYFYISGSESRYDYGQLLIGKIESRVNASIGSSRKKVEKSKIGTNVSESDSPPLEDKLVKIYDFPDKGYFHAGGMDIEGSIVAVPLEHTGGKSKIQFLNINSPESPAIFPSKVEIRRFKTTGKAGACGLIRLKNGKYLCFVWSDSDKELTKLEPRFDIYISATSNIGDGFKHNGSYLKKRLIWNKINNHPKNTIKFQNIQIFQNSKDEIYLYGTDNTGKITPYGSGTNRAHLMRITIAEYQKGDTALLDGLEITYYQSRSFNVMRYPYNFKAGAGFFRNAEGQLDLYSVAHWRSKKGDKLSFGEFSRTIDKKFKNISHIDFAQLEFYEERNFGYDQNKQKQLIQKKRFLRLLGKQCLAVADLKEYKVQEYEKKGFHKKISSIKGVIPKGYSLLLYSKENYSGKKHPKIKGTGKYFERTDLRKNDFEDRIRSLKLIKN